MRNKRMMSFLLVMVLVLASFTSVFASPNMDIQRAKEDNQEVRLIVELDEKPIIEYAAIKGMKFNELDKEVVSELTGEYIKNQKDIQKDIKTKKIKAIYHNSFVNLVNGFSLTTKAKNIEKIKNLPGVKKVSIANEYQRPEPLMNTSRDIVKAGETWALDIKGEGIVVAILDTGIDSSHRDMILTDASKAKYADESIMDAKIEAEDLPGEWYTDKVPYGYNYMDNNNIILDLGPDASMHGMHVAGTVGANGDIENGGIKGVAPEVQLLAMKVFGNDPGMPSTFGDVLIRAMDDAVALGADVMNLSLGSTASFVQPNDPEQMAVTRAVENGVIMAISAGNSDKFGVAPLNENPDVGVVGSPGLTSESIQVASIENTHMKISAAEYGEETLGYIPAGEFDPAEVFSGAVEYAYCNLGGTEEDFEGVELEGKIALIQRGAYNFTDKIMNAQNRGAIGVIVFNDKARGDGLISMQYPGEGKIPAVFMGHSDGMKLLSQKDGEEVDPSELNGLIENEDNKISFSGVETVGVNPDAGKMSSFTSWGVTPSLDLKPEITAPGGNIYSTLNNDKYGLMSGTSMAAPHVAGGSALIAERVNKDFSDLSEYDKGIMVKNILMATAEPHNAKGLYNDYFGLGNYTSPRRQGAGVMNVFAAATTQAVVTEKETGIAKVNLREIGDNSEFTLSLQNFGDKAITYTAMGSVESTYTIEGAVETFEIYDADTEEAPIEFVGGETITVEPGETVDVNVKIDLSNAKSWATDESLADTYENGNFVEGFIRFIDVDDNEPMLSVPYVGFYGEWDKAPIVDASVYDEERESVYGITGIIDGDEYFLGESLDEEEYDESRIAFSPNEDGVRDSAMAVLSFLRNAKELKINILDKDGKQIRNLANQKNIIKNYYEDDQYKINDVWEWDGSVNGKVIEGEYIYQVKAKIDYPEAQYQTFEFPVKVDITKPTIIKSEIKNDRLRVRATDSGSYVYYYELVADGKVVGTNDTGIFSDYAELVGESENVYVRAYDNALNVTEKAVQGTIPVGEQEDILPPYVFMERPEAFSVYKRSVIVARGHITDESRLAKLTIDGADVDFEYNQEEGQYDFEHVLMYEDGVQKIDVTAVDNAGNEINFERKIFVDTTDPVIEDAELSVDRIVDNSVNKVKVTAKISDNFNEMRVLVNGNEAFYNEAPIDYMTEIEGLEYELEYELELDRGENIITIEVKDIAGNKVILEVGRVYRKRF